MLITIYNFTIGTVILFLRKLYFFSGFKYKNKNNAHREVIELGKTWFLRYIIDTFLASIKILNETKGIHLITGIIS